MLDSKTIVVLIFLLACAAIYFLPSIIAVARHHHNAFAICLFNLLAGGPCWMGRLIGVVSDGNLLRIDNHGV